MEKPRVTEIQVRMDCNGCVQKIKKALHGITGIYDLYIDFPQQKITVVGCADPESRTPAGGPLPSESTEQPQAEEVQSPMEGQNEEAPPTSQQDNPPPELTTPPEPATETKTQPTQPQNVEEIHVIYHHPPNYGSRYTYGHFLQQDTGGQQRDAYPTSPQIRGEPSQPPQPTHTQDTYRPSPGHYLQQDSYPTGPQIRGEPSQPPQPIHAYDTYRPLPYVTRYAYPHPEPGYTHCSIPGQVYYSENIGRQWNAYPSSPQIRVEPPQSQPPPQPTHVTHSYNAYKPSPYVTEYAYPQTQPGCSHYNTPDSYNQVYYSGNNSSGNGNITSMFSEENPNACSIA